jgi:hypothetical protein
MKAAMVSALAVAVLSAASASAETCAEAADAFRIPAGEGQALMNQMQEIQNRHSMIIGSIAMEQQALDDYGWDPDIEDYIDELEASRLNLEHQWSALQSQLGKVEPRASTALKHYETVCGADADSAALLTEFGITRN